MGEQLDSLSDIVSFGVAPGMILYQLLRIGFSRKSPAEKKRFFEVSRGSLIEVDTALDISIELLYLEEVNLNEISILIISCFTQLSKLIRSLG